MKKILKIIGIGTAVVFLVAIFGYYALAMIKQESPNNVAAPNEGNLVAADIIENEPVRIITAATLPDNSSSTISTGNILNLNIVTSTLTKKIVVDLKEQRLTYYDKDVELGSFLISSGLRSMPTPTGTFYVQFKRPIVHYIGPGYDLPNTKWNLQFLPHYYIHGAYWHNNFGHPMSHGCVNVSYQNMEALYNWADVGTQVIIHS